MTNSADEDRAARQPARRRQWRATLLVALVLLAPSVYLLATVPPLWRDLDAYHQLTNSPGEAAGNGHGPLYAPLVRAPLLAGYAIDRPRGQIEPARRNLYLHPPLTDSGIFALILCQHLALCAGGVSLILAAARALWMRLGLAIFFASNSALYALAHCVGSESLSLVCLLFFTGAGFRLLKNPDPRGSWGWVWFGLALFLCLSARYANLVFVLALPLTFLFVALHRRSILPLRRAAVALAIGLLCLLLARAEASSLARAEGLKYYSKAGYTFLWRVGFLKNIPEPRRDELLAEVSRRAKSPDAKQAITVLREVLPESEPLEARLVMERIRLALPPRKGESIARMRRAHVALNEAVTAFLSPPTPEHWRAAQTDFARARAFTPARLVHTLFETTTYYFDHSAAMPEVAALVTYRTQTRASLLAQPKQNAYLHLWSNATFPRAFLVWCCLGLGMVWIGKRAQFDLLPLWIYGAILVALGLLMMQMTALVGELIPRYTFPLWELLWFTAVIYAGAIANAFWPNESGAGGKSPPGGNEPG